LSDGLVTIGSNIGLGISAGGTAAAVASVVKGTPISPIQKVGALLVSSAVGASIHVCAIAINRGRRNNDESTTSDITSSKYDAMKDY